MDELSVQIIRGLDDHYYKVYTEFDESGVILKITKTRLFPETNDLSDLVDEE